MGISPYVRRLRERVGHELVLLPSVAVLPWDEQGRLLLVRESQTGLWLSTLNRYVEALGGHLEVRAAFPHETVALSISKTATVRRRRTRAVSPANKPHPNHKTTQAEKTTVTAEG